MGPVPSLMEDMTWPELNALAEAGIPSYFLPDRPNSMGPTCLSAPTT